MKTLSLAIFASLAISSSNVNSIAASNPGKSESIKIQSIDLQAIGAISNSDSAKQPSLIELMRDCSVSEKSAQQDSISSQAAMADFTQNKINKEKEREAYIADVRAQNRRFAAIITLVLVVFFILAGFTSPLFRHKSNKIITENSPFSLSRTMLFVWTYGLSSTFLTVWGATGELPAFVVSLPLFFGIVLITFLFSFFLEKMDTETYNPPIKNQFTLAANNSFKPFLCIPKMQFLLISLFHLGLLCAPAWIYFNFNELSPEILVVQMISSMIYLGHKASKIQRVHGLLFRKSTQNNNAHA